MKVTSTELARLTSGGLILRHGLDGTEATRRRANFGEDGNVDQQKDHRWNDDDDHELVHLHPLWTDAVLEIDMLVAIDGRRCSTYQSDAEEDRYGQQRSEDPLGEYADDEPSFLLEQSSVVVNDGAQPIDGRRDEAERHLKREENGKDRRECTVVEQKHQRVPRAQLEHEIEEEPVERAEYRRHADVNREHVVPIVETAKADDRYRVDQCHEHRQPEQDHSKKGEYTQKVGHGSSASFP